MIVPRTAPVKDAEINLFCVLDILSANRLYFSTAPRQAIVIDTVVR